MKLNIESYYQLEFVDYPLLAAAGMRSKTRDKWGTERELEVCVGMMALPNYRNVT